MNKNGNFKSTVGFVLACVGSAVGMGNPSLEVCTMNV